MSDIGKQYYKNDLFCIAGFRSKTRLQGSKFRVEILKVDYDEYGKQVDRRRWK